MNEGVGGLGRLGTVVGAIAAPTSLVTALLYYFGYYHAYWFFAYFRVHSTLLGFGTADYLMRSLDALWVPMTVTATVGVVVFWGHDLVWRRLATRLRRSVLRGATAAVAVLGFLLTLGGLWSTFTTTFLSSVLTLAPLSLSVGVMLLVYARHLGRAVAVAGDGAATANQAEEPVEAAAQGALQDAPQDAQGPPPAPPAADAIEATGTAAETTETAESTETTAVATDGDAPSPTPAASPSPPPSPPSPPPAPRPEWATLVEWTVVFALVMLGLVWAAGDYAASVGTTRAQRFTAALAEQPSTVVYSEHSLSISGPGVRETRCGNDKAAYGYRYDGLVLILQSGNQYVLVPARWSRADGVALVLPRNDSVRLEFGPPASVLSRAAQRPSC
ncbi:hypothetical protein ACIGEZ_28285 [Streptomyces sp. NPDC085481]|uniref:hypothetical protein n=1 Tax=Streptomyces sp. NPDC085481 TaxID=3365727 RepID=UPI0037CDB7C1